MSSLRRHCLAVVDGVKFELVTSARDVAEAERLYETDANKQPMMYTLGVVHCALQRLKADVPHDFYDFIDALDDFEDLEGDEQPGKSIHAER